MDEVYADYSSAQSATALIAAPGANKAIRVWSIYVMADTIGTVTFLDGTGNNERFKMYPGANGGANKDAPILPDRRNFGLFQVLTNEALDVTSVNAGNHTVHVIFEIVKTAF